MGIKASMLNMLPLSVRQFVRKSYYVKLLNSFENTHELDFFASLVKVGDTVVDVGANIGVYTKRLSELVGSSGQVLSIEPVPATFDILSFNIKKLKLNNVKLFSCAISDVDGQVAMEIPAHASGGDNFYEARIVAKDSLRPDVVNVQAFSLDSLLKDVTPKISFIKIDVEGHELKVIQGALQTIKNSMPSMLIEITRDPQDQHSDAFELFDVLKKIGYQVFLLNETRLEPYYPGAKSTNYFFLPIA